MDNMNSITESENGLTYSQDLVYDEILSLPECRKYLDEPALSDEKILDIKNNLVGIVNSVINYYIEGFK